ncbi:OB-fold protein [Burkholderia glumae]
MALVKCSECGSDVSDKAAACPKCGNPMSPVAYRESQPQRKKKAGVGLKIFRTTAAIIVGFIVMIAWVSHETGSSRSASDTTPTSDQPSASALPPPIEISAVDLYNAYKANEVAADAKYKGKQIKITGIVGTIGKDVMDDPYITLVAVNDFETVNVYFSKARIDDLSKLNKGDSISVTCKGSGMVLGSPMLDCKG